MDDLKHIECLTPHRRGIEIIEKLEKLNIFTANRSFAKGTSANSTDPIEVEVITLIVEAQRADEIFEFLYNELELDKPHNGLIYQSTIKRITPYRLPTEDEINQLNKDKH